MTISEQTMLEGAWWAIMECGRLVQASVAAYNHDDHCAAISLATSSRRALERSKTLRTLASQIRESSALDLTPEAVEERLRHSGHDANSVPALDESGLTWERPWALSTDEVLAVVREAAEEYSAAATRLSPMPWKAAKHDMGLARERMAEQPTLPRPVFPSAKLQDRPDMYRHVFIISGQSRGQAKVGGLFGQPNLPLSYLLSARYVIESSLRGSTLSDVAMPVAYLQRHAVELELKDCLSTARSVKQDEEWLRLLESNREAEQPAVEPIPTIHPLSTLLNELSEALKSIGFETVPRPMTDMCHRITEAENAQPTRYRYLTLKNGMRTFPNPETIPIVELQNALEDLFADFVFEEHALDDDQNFGTRLAWRYDEVAQALGYCLHGLSRL